MPRAARCALLAHSLLVLTDLPNTRLRNCRHRLMHGVDVRASTKWASNHNGGALRFFMRDTLQPSRIVDLVAI